MSPKNDHKLRKAILADSPDLETVTLPRWAIEYILDNATLWDEGPAAAGWKSNWMSIAHNVIERALARDE